MRSPRIAPRINLRFDSHEEMDAIELHANKEGLSLQSWIRHVIRTEIAHPRPHHDTLVILLKKQFKADVILESLADEHLVNKAETISTQQLEHYNRFNELW